MTEPEEKIIRKEFLLLKKRLEYQNRTNFEFVKIKCKNLLSAYQKRWDIDITCLLDSAMVDDLEDIIHDLKKI